FSYLGGDGTSFTPAEAMGKALGNGPVLIRQTGPCKLCYLGDDNRYHHLQALWSRPADKVFLTSLADFQKVVEGGDGQDQLPVVVTATPWKNADPLRLLEGVPVLGDKDKLPQPFLVDPQQRDLRLLRGDDRPLIGVAACTWGLAQDGPLPPLKSEVAVTRKERIVDPDLPEAANNDSPPL